MTTLTKTLAGIGGVAALGTMLMLVQQPSSQESASSTSLAIPAGQFGITKIERSNTVTTIWFTTQNGLYYSLQGKNDFGSSPWMDLYQQTKGNGTITNLADSSSSPQRFYRVWSGTMPKPPPAYPPMPIGATNTGTPL